MDCTTETTTTPRHRAGRAARDTYDEKANHGQESVARQPTLDDGDDVRDANDQHHDFREKIADILHACQWNDLGGLRSLAESPGGFVNDALRQKAWPILLGLSPQIKGGDDDGAEDVAAEGRDWRSLDPHRDEDQVQLDVNRSFIYYPQGQTDTELKTRKSELSSLIVEVLRRYPFLCYFQGYHDICQVFLLVLEPVWRARVVARLSVLRIRDFMLPNLGPTTAQLRLLPDILAAADPDLRRHVAGIEPFYALAGTLTMYAHNIERYRDIVRLFDVFLAREPAFSIYMFAQIVINRRADILEIDEPDMLQVVLSKVPALAVDPLIAASVKLYDRYPPETLPSWKHISDSSTIKTARDINVCAKQTMDDGRRYFHKQASQLWWADLPVAAKRILWIYRRPVRAIGIAVLAAAAALYLRRNPAAVYYIQARIFR